MKGGRKTLTCDTRPPNIFWKALLHQFLLGGWVSSCRDVYKWKRPLLYVCRDPSLSFPQHLRGEAASFSCNSEMGAAALTESHTHARTHTGPTKSPYCCEILANLITIQTVTNRDSILQVHYCWSGCRPEMSCCHCSRLNQRLWAASVILPDWDAALNVAV